MTKRAKPRGAGPSGRRAARLGAVQALYQMDMTGVSAKQVVVEFLQDRLQPGADTAFFSELVTGAAERQADLDGMIAGALVEGWTVERLETVLRAILRVGAYELLVRTDVPPRVALKEYLEISDAFFGGREPTLVNGVLNRLAHVLRGEELNGG